MPSLVIRLYETPDAAAKVVDDLKAQRFSDDIIQVLRPGATGTETVHSIRETGIPHIKAQIYAEALTGDRALVVINPPFGEGMVAEEIVDKHNPIEAGISPRLHEASDFSGDATPFSRWFGWRVLLKDPTPFSTWLGWRVLSEKQSPSVAIKLSDNPAPLSSALGLSTLSASPAPFSLRAGWRLLVSNPAPLSTRMGWNTLSSKKFALGDVKLSDDPAPFSRLFGFPVLTKKQ
jgi:hypothetical protein